MKHLRKHFFVYLIAISTGFLTGATGAVGGCIGPIGGIVPLPSSCAVECMAVEMNETASILSAGLP